MCDTLVALPSSTAHGHMILAKNSDRETNEAQNITFQPALTHEAGSTVKTTYLEIPQVEKTAAVLLSRPFWMWGAEMGVNEYGVAIGNEAVFTSEKYEKTGLTGMDLLRLALERSESASEARQVIIDLLTEYGQGGNCGHTKKFYYHNSFIIADAREAFILETAGAFWAMKQVEQSTSISNSLTITDDYTELHPQLAEGGSRIDFSRKFSAKIVTGIGKGRERCDLTRSLLNRDSGTITASDMMQYLRTHTEEPYRPGDDNLSQICMHAGSQISSQTTGSMVAVLQKNMPPLIYLTGTAAPCLNIFKPHVLLKGMQSYIEKTGDLYGSATDRADEATLWWQGEAIHRRALENYPFLASLWQEVFLTVENRIVSQVEKAYREHEPIHLYHLCIEQTEKALQETRKGVEFLKESWRTMKHKRDTGWRFSSFRARKNKEARFRLS